MGKRVLGRGLDALIPTGLADSVREVPLDSIVPDKSQPRMRFDDRRLSELADSIREHGILQPLIVSRAGPEGKHRLIVGERRWQAARIAGLKTAPIMEKEATDSKALEIALVENLQRQDLDPLEEAAAFNRLIRDYSLTQEDVAQRVGRSRPSVTNALRLLNLPSTIKSALTQGSITEGHARAIAGLEESAAMDSLLERVVRLGLNVRQTEQLVASAKEGRHGPPGPSSQPLRETEVLEERLRRSLGTKVSIVSGRKASRIIIEYYSQEDLDGLLDRLLGSET